MAETIITFFRELTGNDYLTLFVISMIPIVELRGAIIFMGGMDVDMIAGMFCCVAGSSVLIIPIILLIRPIIHKLKKSKTFGRIGGFIEDNLNDRAPDIGDDRGLLKKRMSMEMKKFWGVLTFVAVPLPMTGSWTGSAIAGILDFKLWKASLAVFLGNIIASGILTLTVAFVPKEYTDYALYGFIILAIAIMVIMCFARLRKHNQIEQKLI